MSREVREDQHGTTTGYHYGCRCVPCRDAINEYQRDYKARNPERIAALQKRKAREWRRENLEYSRAYQLRHQQAVQSASRPGAQNTWKRWEPHEDALLVRIQSNISAAAALGRTVTGVRVRRRKLREKGILV